MVRMGRRDGLRPVKGGKRGVRVRKKLRQGTQQEKGKVWGGGGREWGGELHLKV